MLLSEAAKNYLMGLKTAVSALTFKNYSLWIRRFSEFCGEITLDEIDLALIQRYKSYLQKRTDPVSNKKLTTKTINYHLIALRAFLKYLNEQQLTDLDWEGVFLEKQTKKAITALDKTDIEKMLICTNLSKLEGLRDRIIMELLFCTGLRVSALRELDRDDIYLDEKLLKQIVYSGMQNIPLPDELVEHIRRYLSLRKDTFKPLFIRFQGFEDPYNNGEKMRLSERTIERIVRKYARLAGLSNATPQVIRNSFAILFYKQGEDLTSLQQRLDHKNNNSTRNYLKLIDTKELSLS